MTVSRRGFVGGLAAALGYLGTGASVDVFGQNRPAGAAAPRAPRAMDDYDTMAHLSSNENCWGPPESVMKSMNSAWKYSNRYGYPDGNLVGEIAKHHGVKPENILLGAGSGEILDVVGAEVGDRVLLLALKRGHESSFRGRCRRCPLPRKHRSGF